MWMKSKYNINEMKSENFPRSDGISALFYETWNKRLAPTLNVFKESRKNEGLPPSFRKAHTVLIPKSKDVSKLEQADGYRPISLLNCDYKIFARSLAGRLQAMIYMIVRDHQIHSIKGRNIQTNIHIIRAVLKICQRTHEPAALLQLDPAKAFDRVEHSFLFALIRHLQAGENIERGVKLLYWYINKNKGAVQR